MDVEETKKQIIEQTKTRSSLMEWIICIQIIKNYHHCLRKISHFSYLNFFSFLLISLFLYSLFKPTNSINPILTTVDRVKFAKSIKFPSLQTNFSSTTNELQIESLENLDKISMEFNLSKEIKEIQLILYSICISLHISRWWKAILTRFTYRKYGSSQRWYLYLHSQ